MHNRTRTSLVVLGLTLITLSITGQSELDPLPRRGYFGVGLEQAENGVRAFAVAPGSTAAAAGVLVGDIIAAIDGRPAISPEAAVAAIGRHKSGGSVRIDLLRNG